MGIKDKLQRSILASKEVEKERTWLAEQIRQRDEAYKLALTVGCRV